MAKNRKLGRTTDIRLSMLKTELTDLIWHEKIETTDARAKEVKAMADSIISLAIKEKDNFDEVEVTVTTAKLDSKGNKLIESVKSKNDKEYQRVVKETKKVKRQKDQPSRMNARRKMIKMLNKVHDEKGNTIDLTDKLFNDIAGRYKNRVGGYTRIVKKAGSRRGDGAEMVILQLLED